MLSGLPIKREGDLKMNGSVKLDHYGLKTFNVGDPTFSPFGRGRVSSEVFQQSNGLWIVPTQISATQVMGVAVKASFSFGGDIHQGGMIQVDPGDWTINFLDFMIWRQGMGDGETWSLLAKVYNYDSQAVEIFVWDEDNDWSGIASRYWNNNRNTNTAYSAWPELD